MDRMERKTEKVKHMFKAFYPKEYRDSAYDIPYEKFYREGIRGVIFDIDNTLVPHGAPADQRAKELFLRLHGMGMKTCLLSNNKEPRVASFASQVKSPSYFYGGKPGTKGYQRAMGLMGTDCRTSSFCGRPAVYGCVWGQQGRHLRSPDKAHPSQRGDSDRAEEEAGGGGTLLQEGAKNRESTAEIEKEHSGR